MRWLHAPTLRSIASLAVVLLPGCSEAPLPLLDDLATAAAPDMATPPDLAGTCVGDSDCMMGLACCRGLCVDTRTSVTNCGSCGRACAGAMTCCAGVCADTASDTAHCGACGKPCQPAHAKAACARGVCTVGMCEAGYSDCSGGPDDGCEIASSSDLNNCGACGMACAFANATAGCVAGACKLQACTAGYFDCDAAGMNGCEVNTMSDPNHCGGCGLTCLQRDNAAVRCMAGACLIQSCNANFLDCDKDSSNGCEIDSQTSFSNCGACGMACPMGAVCKAGQCTCPPCNLPNAKTTACVNLKCVVETCHNGVGDCDKLPQNGCEAFLNSDAKNCGGCGMACPAQNACIGAMCIKVYQSCAALLADVPQAKDGGYPIDVDGAGPIPAVTAWCDMTTSGGGWTIVYSSAGLDSEVGLAGEGSVPGNGLGYEYSNMSRDFKMALSALSKESLFKRKQDGAWLRADAPLYDNMLTTPNSHSHVIVNLTASNGVTAKGAIGYANHNASGGGDYGVSLNPDAATCNGVQTNGFDHHSANYWHLNCGCQRQYLYSYSSGVLDNDQQYNVNTGLGSWTVTQNCASIESGGLSFYAAMR